MTDLVINNATVVTCDAGGTVIDRGGVAVASGRIVALGTAEQLAAVAAHALNVVDGSGHILMPGLSTRIATPPTACSVGWSRICRWSLGCRPSGRPRGRSSTRKRPGWARLGFAECCSAASRQ